LSVTAEAGLGDHKSCTNSAGTSCGSPVEGYLMSGRRFESKPIGLYGGIVSSPYFIYHIDKVLSAVPREMSVHFDLIVVRENCCDQGDTFVCGKTGVDEPLPGWRFTAQGSAVELAST